MTTAREAEHEFPQKLYRRVEIKYNTVVSGVARAVKYFDHDDDSFTDYIKKNGSARTVETIKVKSLFMSVYHREIEVYDGKE